MMPRLTSGNMSSFQFLSVDDQALEKIFRLKSNVYCIERAIISANANAWNRSDSPKVST